jgi:hypothetical protein
VQILQTGFGNEDDPSMEDGNSNDRAEHKWVPVEDSDSTDNSSRDAVDFASGRRHQSTKKKARGTHLCYVTIPEISKRVGTCCQND